MKPEPIDVPFTVIHDPRAEARRKAIAIEGPADGAIDAEYRLKGEPRWAPLGRWWRETSPRYRDPKFAVMAFLVAVVGVSVVEQIRLLFFRH